MSSVAVSGDYQAHFPLEIAQFSYSQFFLPPTVDSSTTVAAIFLSDSANNFSALHASNPRCQDRLTRLHLCYIRDGLDIYNVSFLSAGFNLSDAGTKAKGLVFLVYKL